jgi:hypothetical protein
MSTVSWCHHVLPNRRFHLYEEGDDVVVKAETPGVGREDIEVRVTDSMLTISGRKERKEEITDDKYYRCERSHGSFSRSVELPGEVQKEAAARSFRFGCVQGADSARAARAACPAVRIVEAPNSSKTLWASFRRSSSP